MTDIIVIAHNIRSTHNVGSIFRTCEGFGVKKLILSGYTPYPSLQGDTLQQGVTLQRRDERLPHIAEKLSAQIHKTALGAEELVLFEYLETPPLAELHDIGYRIVGLEQDARSVELNDYKKSEKIALLLGEEVYGIERGLLDQCNDIIGIPMKGQKESFNVSVAAGIALYGLST